MSFNGNVNADFVHYLKSMINLNALDRMTEGLDEELQDSQEVMNQIKGLIDSLPKNAQDLKPEPNSGCRHEDVSNFLNDSTPNLLMPDMVAKSYNLNLDDVIGAMKSYAENIKKNLILTEPKTQSGSVQKDFGDLDLKHYAQSLDVLCKRLNNLKLNKKDEGDQRNLDLEAKLTVLCDDVDMFTKMVQAKTTLSNANKSWTSTQQHDAALQYDQVISKLLSGINEVSYLIHNKN